VSTLDVTSFLNARVWLIEVKVGDRVAPDDVLVILESMKTEIPVEAPRAGTVKEICVQAGDLVVEDQVLMRIEA
jgi:biotin carboxyl carrier protein